MKNLNPEARLKFDSSLDLQELEKRIRHGKSSDTKTPIQKSRPRSGGMDIKAKRKLLSTSSGDQLVLDCYSDGSTQLGTPSRWKQRVLSASPTSRISYLRRTNTPNYGTPILTMPRN